MINQTSTPLEPTYQASFLADPYAQAATRVGQALGQQPEWMHKTALALLVADEKRKIEKGKPLSADHLKQLASKMAQ